MRIAIVITLAFAALTSALGAHRSWLIARAMPHVDWQTIIGGIVATSMALWFAFAAMWESSQ